MSLLTGHSFYGRSTDDRRNRTLVERKLPIYDPPATLLERRVQPLPFEHEIGQARVVVEERYGVVVVGNMGMFNVHEYFDLVIHITCTGAPRCADLQGHVGRAVDAWFAMERAAKQTTRRILDATEEPLVPNAAYILVAGMFGSILARNRHLPARLLLPPTTATLAASYFMPKTSANAATFLANVTVGPEERMRMEQRVRDGYARVLDAPVRATRGVVDAYDGAVRAVDAKMDGTYREVLETAGRAVNDAKKSVGLGWLSMSGGNGSVAEANKDAPVMDKDATVIDKKDE